MQRQTEHAAPQNVLPDDLDALKRYGQAQTFVFLVDSSRRDKNFWKSPNEYEISLSHPLRNVFSVSLLSASVPRSGYTVDASKNTLALTLTARTPAVSVVVVLDPANYTLPTLCEALNAAFAASAASDAGFSVAPLSSPPDLANKVSISCSEPFSIDYGASTLAGALGFADPPPSGGAYASAAAEGESVAAYDGPVPVANYRTASDENAVTQAFKSLTSGQLTSVQLYAQPHAEGAYSAGVTVRLLDGTAATVLASASGSVTATTSSIPLELAFSAAATLTAGTQYVLQVAATTASAPVDVFVELSNVASDDAVAAEGGVAGSGGLEGQEPEGPRQVCASAYVAAAGHALQSSGVCDLTGARMAIVRLPDIEQLAYEGREAESSILTGGLGVVQMGGWGYNSATFTGFPPRVFHPLTKLSKFRIRIEDENGNLFPANGINHTLQLAVSYLVPAAPDEINLLKKLLNNK